jgi:hypothetical protein
VAPGETVADVEEPDAEASVKSEPVPLRAITSGLSKALSVTVMVPVIEPPVEGVKVTLTVQVEPGFRVAGAAGQLLVWAKLLLAAMLVMVRFAPPAFVTVTVWRALVVPTAWLWNERFVEENETKGTRAT